VEVVEAKFLNGLFRFMGNTPSEFEIWALLKNILHIIIKITDEAYHNSKQFVYLMATQPVSLRSRN